MLDPQVNYLPTVEITDEVQAVQEAIAKAKAASSTAALYVVIGQHLKASANH